MNYPGQKNEFEYGALRGGINKIPPLFANMSILEANKFLDKVGAYYNNVIIQIERIAGRPVYIGIEAKNRDNIPFSVSSSGMSIEEVDAIKAEFEDKFGFTRWEEERVDGKVKFVAVTIKMKVNDNSEKK